MTARKKHKRREPEHEQQAPTTNDEGGGAAPGNGGSGEPESAEAWRDRALRAQAEMVNMRRRLEEEIENRTRMRLEGVLHEVITLADHLDLAIASLPEGLAGDKAAQNFVQGVRAIHAAMESALERQGLVKIQPEEDQAFDSAHHEAIRIDERPDVDGERLELVRRGYRLGRRILRPAQVVLVRPAGPDQAEEKEPA